jgi:hypothetical protein
MPAVLAALLLGLALLLAGCSDAGEDVSVYDIRVGDCFNDPGEISKKVITEKDLPKRPCTQPHDNEIFAVFEHPGAKGAPFPGDDELERFVGEECLERFEAYVGEPYNDSTLAIGTIRPVKKSWEDEDDRAAACFLYGDDHEPLTGSKRGSGA